MKFGLTLALMTALSVASTPATAADHFVREFAAAADGEAVAVVRAGCERCDWGAEGRESVALAVSLDGRYSQHIQLARGEANAEYRIMLGPVAKGSHRLAIDRDPALSAAGAGPAAIDVPDVALIGASQGTDYTALSMAPIVYARPNTVGKFTDLPLVMWYEIVRTPRGRQFRYSVIFSNEDGGTQTDRLMATWGRTTDIEFIYGVELDAAGKILAEEFQGPGHEVPAFTGQHEARHPLVWVSTDNNMVSESGSTRIRYRLVPKLFDLTNDAREAVMDASPWTYAIAAVEMRREGKVAADPPPGLNKIADPRRFAFVEACGAVANAALALSIGTMRRVGGQPDSSLTWTSSDRGRPEYRIVRDGCFTIATPLPEGTQPSDIRAIRVYAYDRPPARGGGPAAPGFVNLTRINKVFMLDQHDQPGKLLLHWEGSAPVPVGGAPFEVPIR
jgi:hypothetical protein